MSNRLILRWFLSLTLVVMVTGCATMFSEKTQNLTVSSNPVGAQCTVQRNSVMIAKIDSTPGSFSINRNMNEIEAKCEKSGYSTVKVYRSTGFNTTSLWNILNGFGFIIDLATGALFEYEQAPIFVELKAN